MPPREDVFNEDELPVLLEWSESESARSPLNRFTRKQRALVACGAGALASCAVFAPRIFLQTPPTHVSGDRADAQEAAESQIALFDSNSCTGAGLDCRGTKCCKDPGFQCFVKNAEWAGCQTAPLAGWAGTPLGVRTAISSDGKCSAKGDNCKTTQCCVTPGNQCYNKDDFWAGCKAACTATLVNGNRMDAASWDCVPLGPRTPGEAPVRIDNDDFWKPTGPEVEPGASALCSWAGDDCSQTKCCKNNGMKCYQMNDDYSGCNKDCNKTNPIDGRPWTCNVLGDNAANQSPLQPGTPSVGTTLYCFSVINPSSYEEKLVGNQEYMKRGIYACDFGKWFHGRPLKVSAWGSVANVDLFIDIWHQIKAEGQYANYDWSVKVDADATFFPNVLKQHIEQLRAPASYERGLYLKNCDYQFGYMGSLEVVSSKAIDTYVQHVGECVKSLGNAGGEDYFMMTCMDGLGVGHMYDTTLLKDNYALPNHAKFNITSVDHCADGWAVAFHPHKTAERWNACWDRAEQARAAYLAQSKS